MTSTVAKYRQTADLLNRILDQPGLSAIIKHLDAGLLTRLILHVGLEDSGPIVSQASPKQLKAVFDEDLWQRGAPGRAELFDAARFGLWLNIMMENGPDFAARRILEIDEDLLILGMCRLVHVEGIHPLEMFGEDDYRPEYGRRPDGVSEESLNQVVSDFHLISKDDSSWEAILELILYLDETQNDTLVRLLRRCSRICETCDDEHEGLLRKFSGQEMLEADVAAERENRKESRGFVTPVSAALFLAQSRNTSLNRIVAEKRMPHAAGLYVRAAEAETVSIKEARASDSEASESTRKEMTVFIETLREAEVLPAVSQQKLGYDDPDFGAGYLPLTGAMRLIKGSAPDLYARRIMELSYLSNALISGCGFRGREFRPQEAAEAALSVCNLGSEYLFEAAALSEREETLSEFITALIKTDHLIHLFRVGWKILYDRVILAAAKCVLGLLDRLDGEISEPEQRREIDRMARSLRAGISCGRPWNIQEEIDYLQVFLDGETTEALGGLIQEFPALPTAICRKGNVRLSSCIWSHEQIRMLRQFLEEVPERRFQ